MFSTRNSVLRFVHIRCYSHLHRLAHDFTGYECDKLVRAVGLNAVHASEETPWTSRDPEHFRGQADITLIDLDVPFPYALSASP